MDKNQVKQTNKTQVLFCTSGKKGASMVKLLLNNQCTKRYTIYAKYETQTGLSACTLQLITWSLFSEHGVTQHRKTVSYKSFQDPYFDLTSLPVTVSSSLRLGYRLFLRVWEMIDNWGFGRLSIRGWTSPISYRRCFAPGSTSWGWSHEEGPDQQGL